MIYKRYIIIVGSFLLAIVLDAVIYTGLLDASYSGVPALYHIGTILMLGLGFTVLGDYIFKGDVLR